MNSNFKALHYDGTISLHGNLRVAMREAIDRLEPWREGSDRVVQQVNETTGSEVHRVLVVNSVNQPTDAASHISPCGDWIDARECLPKVDQKILVVFYDNGHKPMLDEACATMSDAVKWVTRRTGRPRLAWWRPLPALPVDGGAK